MEQERFDSPQTVAVTEGLLTRCMYCDAQMAAPSLAQLRELTLRHTEIEHSEKVAAHIDGYPGTVNGWAQYIHEWAVSKGWWETERNFGETLALMHSELSESMEAWRKDEPDFWLKDAVKPEGVATELVDCMIRIMDTLAQRGVNIQAILEAKMAYNYKRPYRHGGLKA